MRVDGLGHWATLDPMVLNRNAATQKNYPWLEAWESDPLHGYED